MFDGRLCSLLLLMMLLLLLLLMMLLLLLLMMVLLLLLLLMMLCLMLCVDFVDGVVVDVVAVFASSPVFAAASSSSSSLAFAAAAPAPAPAAASAVVAVSGEGTSRSDSEISLQSDQLSIDVLAPEVPSESLEPWSDWIKRVTREINERARAANVEDWGVAQRRKFF